MERKSKVILIVELAVLRHDNPKNNVFFGGHKCTYLVYLIDSYKNNKMKFPAIIPRFF